MRNALLFQWWWKLTLFSSSSGSEGRSHLFFIHFFVSLSRTPYSKLKVIKREWSISYSIHVFFAKILLSQALNFSRDFFTNSLCVIWASSDNILEAAHAQYIFPSDCDITHLAGFLLLRSMENSRQIRILNEILRIQLHTVCF